MPPRTDPIRYQYMDLVYHHHVSFVSLFLLVLVPVTLNPDVVILETVNLELKWAGLPAPNLGIKKRPTAVAG